MPTKPTNRTTEELNGALLAMPAVQMSQKLTLEAARFWAKRARAVADQMETLAACTNPSDMIAAQSKFFQRAQEDYAEGASAMTEIVKASGEGAGGTVPQR
jgi:hypothetical protein